MAGGDERHTRSNNGDYAPRTKRAKYTAAACESCKRRKIKCHVDTTEGTRCRRCKEQDIECVYSISAPSDNTNTNTNSEATSTTANTGAKATTNTTTNPAPTSHPSVRDELEPVEQRLARLEDQLTELRSKFAQHCHPSSRGQTCLCPSCHYGPSSAAPPIQETDPPASRHHQPHFLGPTRPAYAFNIARASIQDADIPVDDPNFSSPPSPHPSTPQFASQAPVHITDPLRTLHKAEVLRLLSVYEEELASVYPVFDIPALVSQTQRNYDSWINSPVIRIDPAELDVVLLRVTVATASTIETMKETQLNRQLIMAVETDVFRTYSRSAITCREAVIFTVLSIYYFLTDQELIAWRRIGDAARGMLELGLHRKHSLLKNIPNDRMRTWAVRLFWCIYILDRRWSIGLSLPFALQDADIDPELLQPDSDAEYLRCMVQYGKICSRLWQSYPNLGSSASTLSKETISYLEFQIDSWGKSIPKNLRLYHATSLTIQAAPDATTQRLRSLLHLRKNHLSMLVSRHHVLSRDAINENMEAAYSLVGTAEDSIAVLVRLNDAGSVYVRQQAAFNHFLMTALTIIFLAVCHAPSEFRNRCRPAFDGVIKLVRASAASGSNGRRLWRMIQGLLPYAHGTDEQAQSLTDTRQPQITPRERTDKPNEQRELAGPSIPQHTTTTHLNNTSAFHPSIATSGLVNAAPQLHPPPHPSPTPPPPMIDLLQPIDFNPDVTMGSYQQPMQNLAQMTDDLTKFYNSLEPSDLDNDFFQFGQVSYF